MQHKEKEKEQDVIIEVVIPYEEADLVNEVEQLLRGSLQEYPNVIVRR